MDSFYQQICERLGTEHVLTGEPMSRHTTFRAGGKADYYLTPADTDGLRAAVLLCRESGMPYYILGNGSDLLVGDYGYHGAMISTESCCSGCGAKDGVITAGSGVLLSQIARLAAEQALTGFEFASGIPGTLGGALVMNAGAYGGEMKDVVKSVLVMDAEGREKRIAARDMEFGYRKSCIAPNGYIALEASIELAPGRVSEIQARMGELAAKRRDKQPLEYPSAGSTFKRPEGHFAGKLIEDAGLKGASVGGAQVSTKHSGFVINTGGATAADILGLCRLVQAEVKRQFGVELELEVKMIGDFSGEKQ